MDAQKMDLADKVRRERKERGLTQQDLADLAGVKLAVVNNFERHVTFPQRANLRAILHALDLDEEAPTRAAAPDLSAAALDMCPNCNRVRWPETYELVFDILGAYMDTLDAAARRAFMIQLTAPVVAKDEITEG